MEEIRKTLYTQHFSKQNHIKILEKSNTFKYQYHLIITYKNITKQRELFKSLFKNNNNIITYNYACYNRKGYSKQNSNTNRHKAKIHTHTLVLAKHELELENIINMSKFRECDIKLVKVYSHINDVISYIFDGHHTILSNSNRYSFYGYATGAGKTKAKYLENVTTTTNLTLKQQISLLRRFSATTRMRI